MNRPNRVLIWMLVFLVAVAAVSVALFDPLRAAFLANRIFNGMILGVLTVGIAINFRQVITLNPEIAWIQAFRENAGGLSDRRGPRLLAPMAKMLTGRSQERFRLSAMTMRSLLDGIRLRLDEHRDVSRYMIGLLVFLGLLGTFWGLLDTVVSAGNVIAGLSIGEGELTAGFDELKRNLQGPLAGMGTAFSSSLFGLGGALVLGFMDLQGGHAQNRFYNELEEWLSELTHLPTGTVTLEGEQPFPAYVEVLLEQTADNLDKLRRTVIHGEEERRAAQSTLLELTERLSALTDQMRTEQKLMLTLAKSHADLQPAIARLADAATGGWSTDDETRAHIRNVDVCLTRFLQEFSSARAQLPETLRNEIRLLARTIAQKPGTDT